MTSAPRAILAVDPGREKCGIAAVDATGRSLEKDVIAIADLASRAAEIAQRYGVSVIVIGDRTGADAAAEVLERALPDVETAVVDEHRSTEEARRLYFREHPPRGWKRLLPIGLQTPPRPYDDYVAVVLARRYLQGREGQAF